ncbi:glutaminyl-peptide cyclotransferase isoform X2 [Macadamia integrifolia]|uniref:glutaminyl-peptide cyclotransferase isoform X2 n=1 Tax=Macadamia integrifolia TaxID=60698 RepID=UPI001C4F505A|nr:glutaminyl-peptide cyclotransferase isoform X2 [Macadamia integrifolia]
MRAITMVSSSLKRRAKRTTSQPSPSMASTASSFSWRRSSLLITLFLVLCVPVVMLITSNSSFLKVPLAHYSIEVVNEFPHDPKAFTQGLLYGGNDTLYESTGLYSEVEIINKMDASNFGEGLTLLGKRLFQVIWLKKTGFIYDRYNLRKLGKFTHQMQDGWGLATDGKILFGSDGTSTLYKLDPQTFKVIGKTAVRYNGHEVYNLNELEYINGEVWANVWQTDCIARISYKDGTVLGWILLNNLRETLIATGDAAIDVLNGIAWDEEKNRIFVTGKLWPKLYEIKLHPIRALADDAMEQLCLRRPFNFAHK